MRRLTGVATNSWGSALRMAAKRGVGWATANWSRKAGSMMKVRPVSHVSACAGELDKVCRERPQASEHLTSSPATGCTQLVPAR